MIITINPFFSDYYSWHIVGLRILQDCRILSHDGHVNLDCKKNCIVNWNEFPGKIFDYKVGAPGETSLDFKVYQQNDEGYWAEHLVNDPRCQKEHLDGIAWLSEKKYNLTMSSSEVKKLLDDFCNLFPNGVNDEFKSQVVSVWRKRYVKAVLRELSENNGMSNCISELKKYV